MIFEKPTYSELDDKVNPIFFFFLALAYLPDQFVRVSKSWLGCLPMKTKKGEAQTNDLEPKKKKFL